MKGKENALGTDSNHCSCWEMMRACPKAMAGGQNERIQLIKWHVRERGVVTDWRRGLGGLDGGAPSPEWFCLALIYIVVLFSRYGTNCHTLSSLKRPVFISQCMSVRSLGSTEGAFCSGPFRSDRKALAGLCSYLEAQLGTISVQAHSGSWQVDFRAAEGPSPGSLLGCTWRPG